ncbi:SpoIIE family protein phosphatase [Cytophaga hutchinsonii]|uniref:Anti-sigma regulatory factor (Ser/Thr protein kinase) n=1 Tax=Cytophaga hutchinsonii (strain ATCC 33406 / DSM 1761 / CIP 103989 / NBRC 15051 / NCIMB 9469 / D465) TaxID=269798 RepID=A0A6N4SQ63_CYTH3|nr:SpoIIE family protein phosphatase [Cytophaga hutchinsonii]ABG58489.1 anti-sigma regulatory factor (Ser/Thr protein kinase) [Cytophaga hutchinsonii ATCC 33406]SFX75541.1 Anti-sigma regulatory factor (Ser/Thr protein kinase) [Cytophaga hutchinsonii ATCC 33406]
MDNILFQSYIIEERSYASFIKREIHNLVRPHFTEQRTGEIDIVVSEMVSNLIKYATRGELLYRLSMPDNEPFFEVICIDNGTGIKDISHSMKDGISSKSTLGHGIGSIQRLSDFSQIYSQPDWGTILYSQFSGSLNSTKISPGNTLVRCINVALPGEKVSGDGTAIRKAGEKTLVFTGDGLGHGEFAKEAVDAAISTFNNTNYSDPSDIIREIHAAVKKTRGLVATIGILDHRTKEWLISGIGNIAVRLQRGLEYKNYSSYNGIIGLNIPTRIEKNRYEMEKFQQLILCSDGIKTRWDLLHYPSILKYDPMILAAAIYKDHARRTDDMTVLIVKVL